VTPNPPSRDPWRWPAILLWLWFFLLGLWPELTFELFRTAGYVFSQNAIINSYNFITWSLTAFLAYFVYHRSVEAGLPPMEALGKAIQIGVLAFVAFIDLPIEQIPDIRRAGDRALVMGTVGLKLLVWLYLYALLVRYYLRRDPQVIARALPYFALIPPPRAEHAVDIRVTSSHANEDPKSAENPAE
jgi:hypothetical protein